MEIFKVIQEFPSYQISNLGRIKNSKGELINIGKRISNSGYIQVRLHKDKKYYYRYIHRLIAQTFMPNPNNYRTVNHKDGNKKHNVLSNLEWASDEM
ncbi:MAG: NUMOD4 domain-containing protein [Bacilli bacterium]